MLLTKKQLSPKEIAVQLTCWQVFLSKKDHVELCDEKILVINKEPFFFYHENKIIPTLKYLLKHDVLKKIIVDMGAVKFVTSGADIMRPGIVHIDDNIAKDDPVVIIDQTHKKPLAVGIALLCSEDMQNVSSGKVVKNIHWVGDYIWKL